MKRPPGGGGARPALLPFLPLFLFRTDRAAFPYVVKGWLLALLPSIALAAIVGGLMPEAQQPDIRVDGAIMVALLVLAAPLLETLLMIPPLLLLNRLFGPGWAAVGSAALWGAAHSLAAPTWGLVVWWPFLVMSAAMLAWRKRGWGIAILVVTAIHALQNGTAALMLVIAG